MACERRAGLTRSHGGVSCRIRRPIWQPIGYPVAPTYLPHAIGTEAPWETKLPAWKRVVLLHPENPQVRLSTRTLGPFGHAKVAPFPQPCLGAYKGTLWGPVSEIAGTQVPVAGNSNLKLVLVWTSSSVKGMSVLKSDYALGQHAVPVSLELA